MVASCRDGRQRQQADRAGAVDHRLVPLIASGRMNGTRCRLDHHRSFIAEVVGHVDQLAGVGDHPVAPASAGVGAEAALQASVDVPEGDPLAEVDAPCGAHVAHR